MCWYQILKDFAGPAATIVASITAALITWKFASQQTKIAQRQADTAQQQAQTSLDQLRYNLFEKRYQIYLQVEDAIRIVLNRHTAKDFRAFELLPHFIKIKEMSLFFSASLCNWVDNVVMRDVKAIMQFHGRHGTEEHQNLELKILDHFEHLQKHFESELKFPQLTN